MIEQNVVLQERFAYWRKVNLGHPNVCGLWLTFEDGGFDGSKQLMLSSMESHCDMEEKLYCHSMEWC